MKRKFWITYVARIVFLMDREALESQGGWKMGGIDISQSFVFST